MKDMIVVAEKGLENKELLVIENINKIAMAEVTKVSSTIDLRNKYSWIISNIDINVAKNLRRISIK